RLGLFFQAEDGIRDGHVTGVQTCALPIYRRHGRDDDALAAVLCQNLQGLSVGHGHGSYSARKTAPALFSACAWRYAAARSLALRSEERRVGKGCRSGWKL